MTTDRLTVVALTPKDAVSMQCSHGVWSVGIAHNPCAACQTTYPVELGGSMGGSLPTQPVAGVKARVNPGRPITAGPAVCQGCRSLVWWSGALWVDRDGTWHRCSFITPLAASEPEGTIGA